jgi:hypothetical protein
MKIVGVIFAFFIMMFGAYFVVRSSMYPKYDAQTIPGMLTDEQILASEEESYYALAAYYVKHSSGTLRNIRTLSQRTISSRYGGRWPDAVWDDYLDIQEAMIVALYLGSSDKILAVKKQEKAMLVKWRQVAKTLPGAEKKALKRYVEIYDIVTPRIRVYAVAHLKIKYGPLDDPKKLLADRYAAKKRRSARVQKTPEKLDVEALGLR